MRAGKCISNLWRRELPRRDGRNPHACSDLTLPGPGGVPNLWPLYRALFPLRSEDAQTPEDRQMGPRWGTQNPLERCWKAGDCLGHP